MNIPNHITDQQIQLFFSLFKGRTDIYAQRWEKGSKSGYMPVYEYDPYLYRIHRMKGGSFKNYKDKSYKPLKLTALKQHLEGIQFLGIYPLLKDNSSHFIVADFDKDGWQDECLRFIEICSSYKLNVYLERSRSGNGGHVWMFFDQAYLAQRCRKIFLDLLIQSKSASIFEKDTSFDRLFPSQDIQSGKGFGNLIALPLNRACLQNGNNCFLDTSTLEPFSDQWTFLATIKRVNSKLLDSIYQELTDSNIESTASFSSKKLEIRLEGRLMLYKNQMPLELVEFLKGALNFPNEEFFIRRNMGKSTWGINRFFNFIEEQGESIYLPRGFVGRLVRFCKDKGISFNFIDNRTKLNEITISSSIRPLSHQSDALVAASKKDFGVIFAPPGSGKTVIALKIIEEKKQPALIIVHRKQLMDQWFERIEDFLGIPKKEIGKIGQGKTEVGKTITVALIQSLTKAIEKVKKELLDKFGLIIVDECHHIPAKSYYEVFSRFAPYYQYGLTATPFRKKKDEALIFAAVGEIISEIKPTQIESFKKPRVVIRNTSFEVPFDSRKDKFELLSNLLIHDTQRNDLIAHDIRREVAQNRKVLIITERKAHIEVLAHLLKQGYEVITLDGDISVSQRTAKWDLIQKGDFQVLITTGQLFGEGTDVKNISRLFLVYPFVFKGKLIQYIGRVQRSDARPVIYDYRDSKVDYLNKLFLKRNSHYQFFDKEATLFDDQELLPAENKMEIKKQIKIPLSDLVFHHGRAVFPYSFPESKAIISFDLFHDLLRPEFEVLKPYFVKVLKKKRIAVDIQALIQDNSVLAQSAHSEDLDAINQDIIENVRFNFINKEISKLNSTEDNGQNLTKLEDLSKGQINSRVFESEKDLIENLIRNKTYKHCLQLEYLVDKHDYKTLKIRFVLSPFSFLFLISSKSAYYLVLETLNTEEATYIWSCRKDLTSLKERLKEVEEHLETIKLTGRQSLLDQKPVDFIRLLHDYTDLRKGFLKWKVNLEDYLNFGLVDPVNLE